jgi:hypothetical protein
MTRSSTSSKANHASRKSAWSPSESTLQRLNLYSLAAGAAGVGMLALAQPADASVVYTPAHLTIGPGDAYPLDLNHDGNPDVWIAIASQHSNTSTAFETMAANPAPGGSIEITQTRGAHFPAALPPGVSIPSYLGFYRGKLLMVLASENPGGQGIEGNWNDVKDRYLGIKFQINGETHYGWARFTTHVNLGPRISIVAELNGYAYETVPNRPIRTRVKSDTPGPAGEDSKPAALRTGKLARGGELATLGLLALGAPGIPFWRRTGCGLDFTDNDTRRRA